jgi:predicted Zn-dependent protease
MHVRHARQVCLVVVAAALLTTLLGCSGGHILTREDEVRMGQQAATDFERQNGGRATDARIVALTATVGQRIARQASTGKYYAYPYDFRALNNREVNANAFPGGIIYLWRGLFEALKYDEAQLAWVAGHEATHVAERHATQRIERQLGYSLIIELALGRDSAAKIAGAVAGLTLQEYGRDQELEADRVGALFARNAGYDPTVSLAVLETFKRLQGREPSDLEIFFASHPGNTTREDSLKAYFRTQGWSGKYFKP